MASFERFAAVPEHLEHKTVISGKHTNADGNNAFSVGDTVLFSINAPKDSKSASMLVLSDRTKMAREYVMKQDGRCFKTELKMSDMADGKGLYFYKYRFDTDHGIFETSMDPVDAKETIGYPSEGYENAFQLLVYEKRKKAPKWMKGGIMYQIMPDRFCEGDKTVPKDYAVMQKPGDIPFFNENGAELLNKNFFGGNLSGIESKLGYLKSLGVNIIYLNPIFEAYSNHKYDTGDYEHVDSMFGGDEALDSLISACRKNGMHLILDGVFNHTGSDSKYFNKDGRYGKGGAYNDKNSEYYPWYNFEKYPEKYEAWWGIPILPRVKCDNPTYIDYICGENGIVRKYLKKGISGWRLDVADEVSDNFLKYVKSGALKEKSDAVIIGEVWEDASNKVSYGSRRMYFEGDELDSVMNYPLRTSIISYIRDGDSLQFVKTLYGIYGHYPKENCDLLMNILGTHDTERILTTLAGESPEGKTKAELSGKKLSDAEREKGLTLLKLAYTVLATIPGIPCIYYGDEAESEGYGDPLCRRFYPWGHENRDLMDFYKTIGKIRRSEKVYEEGGLNIRFADADIACFERVHKNGAVVTIVNRSDKTYEFRSKKAAELISGAKGSLITIPPMSPAIIKIKNSESYTVSVYHPKED